MDLFTYLGLKKQLERAGNHRIWLDCGGYLVFNQKEALLSIDVNTGKYVGTKNLQDTVVKTNIQSAVEIANQLRTQYGWNCDCDFIDIRILPTVMRSLAGKRLWVKSAPIFWGLPDWVWGIGRAKTEGSWRMSWK